MAIVPRSKILRIIVHTQIVERDFMLNIFKNAYQLSTILVIPCNLSEHGHDLIYTPNPGKVQLLLDL